MAARPKSSPARPLNRRPLRALTVTALSAVLVAGPTVVAHAHVTVKPETTASGGYSQLVFRVPNESDTARTVKLTVTLPKDRPLLNVRTQPLPGWKAVVTHGTLSTPVTVDGGQVTEGPLSITWTAAAGQGLGQGEYQNFPVSVGPLPAPGAMTFAADQTYSDGKVVAWNEPAGVDGAEPQHPAPWFEVTAAAAGGHHGSSAAPAADQHADRHQPATTTPWQGDRTARVLAGGALLAAVAAALLALARGRRTSTR